MNKKKMYLYLGIGVGSIALIVIIVIVVMMVFGSKSVSYSTIESRMVTAAKNYYKKNSSNLPTEEGGQITVDIAALTASGDLKAVSEMVDKGVTCNGNVVVTKTGDGYQYTAYLDCGDNYHTQAFYEKLIDNNVISEFGDGLYELNGGYVYKGETPNNYVKFADHLFRIVKINPDHSILAVFSQSASEKISDDVEWDRHYNSATNSLGINEYSQSSIRKTLSDLYTSDFFTDEDLTKLIPFDLCVGPRSKGDNVNDGSIECQTKVENQYIGLLPFYDYVNASLDTNCSSFNNSLSCTNYNYLNNYSKKWWLLTSATSKSNLVYQVSGSILEEEANDEASPRFTVTFGNYVVYGSGTGTKTDPYIVK